MNLVHLVKFNYGKIFVVVVIFDNFLFTSIKEYVHTYEHSASKRYFLAANVNKLSPQGLAMNSLNVYLHLSMTSVLFECLGIFKKNIDNYSNSFHLR